MKTSLNMSVGQTDLHPVYREALIHPIETPAYFTEYKELYAKLVAGLQTMLQTEQEPFVVLGTGRTGLEVGAYALVGPQDRVLCIENGHWGSFFGDLCRNMGADVERVGSGVGKQIDWAELARRLDGTPYSFVTMAHCETNTGALYDIAKVRELIGRDSGTMLMVDGISAFGSTPVQFDAWGIDVYVGGSQKCLNAIQGTPVVCLSARASERAATGLPGRPYLHTLGPGHKPSYPLVRSLHALVDSLLQEGLDAVYARHRTAAAGIRAGLPALGLSPFVIDPQLQSPSVTRLVFPEGLERQIAEHRAERGIDQDVITQMLKTECGVVIGEDRIGTMGYQTSQECVLAMLEALATVLSKLGYSTDGDAAREAALAVFRDGAR